MEFVSARFTKFLQRIPSVTKKLRANCSVLPVCYTLVLVRTASVIGPLQAESLCQKNIKRVFIAAIGRRDELSDSARGNRLRSRQDTNKIAKPSRFVRPFAIKRSWLSGVSVQSMGSSEAGCLFADILDSEPASTRSFGSRSKPPGAVLRGEQKSWEPCPFPPGSFVDILKGRCGGFTKPISDRTSPP